MRGSEETELTSEQFIKEVSNSDMILVGEVHSDSVTHIVEYELLKAIYTKHNNCAVAFEMFERDVQKILDKYLYSKITEKDFLEKSRPWTNYQSAYKPLIEFAKKNKLPALAMNVPRRYANNVARWGKGILHTIPDSEKVWIARELKCLDDSYKERFMKEMGSQKRPVPMARFDFENLYRAQCLKDDTMAESISDFLEKNQEYKVIAFLGSFHVAYGLGLAKKLHIIKPEINLKVVSCITVDDLSSLNFSTHRDKGDYLIFIARN